MINDYIQSVSKTLLRFLRVHTLCARVFVSMYRCVYMYVHYTSVCVSKLVLSVTLTLSPSHSLSLFVYSLSRTHARRHTHICKHAHTRICTNQYMYLESQADTLRHQAISQQNAGINTQNENIKTQNEDIKMRLERIEAEQLRRNMGGGALGSQVQMIEVCGCV